MKMLERIRKENGGTIRAVSYARFSSDMQREESIDAQEAEIHKYAEQNGIVIVHHYRDRAKTGKNSDRKEFRDMLKNAAKRNFSLVLVHKLDRFARKKSVNYEARTELAKHKVSVIAVAQPFDLELPEGVMMTSFLEAMAEYYSANLATEVEKGRRENAKKALHIGGKPPFGYDVDKETRKLIINEHEARAVRIIFDRVDQGIGYERIGMELRRLGYVTKSGNSFGKNSIHDILKNEKYVGTYVYNKSASKTEDGKRNGHEYKEESEIIRVENGCPAIVDRGVFDRVQKKMTLRRRNEKGGRAGAIETYLLSGKVRCGECGSNYQAQRRKPSGHQRYLSVKYRCSRKNSSIKCINREINRRDLETHVLMHLSFIIFDEKHIDRILADYQKYHAAQFDEFQAEISRCQSRLRTIQGRIDRIVNGIAETGSLAMAEKLKQLEEEKHIAEKHLCDLQAKRDHNSIDPDELRALFQFAQRLMQHGSLPDLQQVIDCFVHEVILYADRVEISFNFGFTTDIFKKRPPDRDHDPDGQSLEENGNPRGIAPVDTSGGEGGTRTLARPKNLIKSLIIVFSAFVKMRYLRQSMITVINCL